jgi:hypothetical protein
MHQKVCNQFKTQKQTTNQTILCVCAAEFNLPTYKSDQQTTNQFMCDLQRRNQKVVSYNSSKAVGEVWQQYEAEKER